MEWGKPGAGCSAPTGGLPTGFRAMGPLGDPAQPRPMGHTLLKAGSGIWQFHDIPPTRGKGGVK